MARSASFTAAKSRVGSAVYASAPRDMNEKEMAAFMTALLKFTRGRTGCPTCISGQPIFILEEEVENAVVVNLA